MTAADWLTGTVAAGALWCAAALYLRKAARQRRARDRRELLRRRMGSSL